MSKLHAKVQLDIKKLISKARDVSCSTGFKLEMEANQQRNFLIHEKGEISDNILSRRQSKRICALAA